MTTRYALLIALAALAASPVAAQETASPVNRFRMGPMGAGTYNIHRGDFTTYDGVVECATFDNTNSIGWLAGYTLHVPLSGPFALSPRMHYWKGDGTFTTPNPF